MASSIPSDFQKLTHNNYLLWKHNALSVLANNKLLKYVERNLIDINREDNESIVVQMQIEHRDIKEPAVLSKIIEFYQIQKTQESQLDEKRALAQLNLMCSSGVQHHIRQEQTARQCWLKLNEVFTQNRGNKWTSRIALIRCPLLTDDFESHIARMQNLFDQLKEVDTHADDDDLIAALLVSLEVKHKTLQSHLLMQKDLSLQDVLTALRRYHSSQKSSSLLQQTPRPQNQSQTPSSSSNQKLESAMFNKDQGSKSKGSKECRYCHKKGHLIEECFKKKKNDETKKLDKSNFIVENNFMTTEVVLNTVESSQGRSCSTHVFHIDSGCSANMAQPSSIVKELKTVSNRAIKTGSGQLLPVTSVGQVNGSVNSQQIRLNDVLVSDQLESNLISVGSLTDNGAAVLFVKDHCMIWSDQKSLQFTHDIDPIQVKKVNGIYPLEISPALCLWHLRSGHINRRDVARAGLPLEQQSCEECILAKQTRLPYPIVSHVQSASIGDLLHLDLWGKTSHQSFEGECYLLCITDDFSRRIFVYPLQFKSDAASHIKQFLVDFKNQLHRSVSAIRSDQGGEFSSKDLMTKIRSDGIDLQFTTAGSHQSNGIAERLNRTLFGRVRAMLLTANLPLKFWALAVTSAAYLKNRFPKSASEQRSPYELWYDVKPDLSHLRIWGCITYLHQTFETDKLKPRAKKVVMVGYGKSSTIYKIFDPNTSSVSYQHNVRFNERSFGGESYPDQNDEPFEYPPWILPETTAVISPPPSPVISFSEKEPLTTQVDQDVSVSLRRSTRSTKGNRYNEVISSVLLAKDSYTDEEPPSFAEAFRCPHWKKAIDEEYESVRSKDVFDLVERPLGQNVVGTRWVFKIKRDAEGHVVRYKARLVAQGFTQIPGVDFSSTYAPVIRSESVRLIFALAAKKQWSVFHFDIKTAFLNGDLTEDVYVHQPQGYSDEDNPKSVWKLKKSLYGLHQSPKSWNEKFISRVKSLGFYQLKTEPSLFRNPKSGQIIGLFVDDLLLLTEKESDRLQLYNFLNAEFEVSDLGRVNHFVGIQIDHFKDQNGMTSFKLHQRGYTERILERFQLHQSHPVSTPMETGLQLVPDSSTDNTISPSVADIPFKSAIGSLMFLAESTRPDISYAVHRLAQFGTCFNQTHWSAVKRVFKYLKGTLNYGITYSSDSNIIQGLSDSNWGGLMGDKCKSTSGYVFYVYGSLVSWSSRKQPTVALSSTEAEYIALCSASTQALWLINLLDELDETYESPVSILCDNTSAVHVAENPSHHGRMKHIDIKFHFIRDKIRDKLIKVDRVPSSENLADLLTKPLPRPAFVSLVNQLIADTQGGC